MLTAVDFDDEPCLGAEEIDNVPVDRGLPLEFPTGKAAVAQAKPEHAFGVGLIATQSLGEVGVHFRHPNPLTPTLSPAGRGSSPSPWHGRRFTR